MSGKIGIMEQIRSKNGKLLHIIFRLSNFENGRVDIIEPDNILQCSALRYDAGKTFKPHRHLSKIRKIDTKAQEAWVVLAGIVEVSYYDIDGELLLQRVLRPGDISFTLDGGHTYKVVTECLIYEFKTGPYEGQELDKIFIDE